MLRYLRWNIYGERWRLGLFFFFFFLKKQHVCLVHHGDDGTLGDENVQV